jgi:hypothetical protein
MIPLCILLTIQDIRPADDGWGAERATVKKVLDAAASELWKHFPGRDLKPILVEAQGGPITLHQRGPSGEYQVKLSTGGTAWCQYTFQFAHEFCHILCGYDQDPLKHRWFEEAVCELASLYVLRRSSETWKTKAPFDHWKLYAPELAKYADGHMKDFVLPKGKTLAAWYKENAAALTANPVDRDRNNVAAVALLPFFEKEPEHWEAVSWLNSEAFTEKATFEEYLAAWRKHSPKKHKPFIQSIAKELGVALKE